MSTEISSEQLGSVFPALRGRKDIKERYKLADKRSHGKTIHDWDRHGVPVRCMGVDLVEQIESIYPFTFTLAEIDYSVPVTCEMHDVSKGVVEVQPDGTAKEIHEIDGAITLDRILAEMDVPEKYRFLVTYPVRFHRTSGILQQNGLEMPDGVSDEERIVFEMCLRTLAILVLADKCVGDRERVREDKAWWIAVLRLFGLSKFWFEFFANQDSRNNFATYAIRLAKLVVDPDDCTEQEKGAIVLTLELDDKVCSLEQILKVDWFAEAFHCCGKAAQYLGFSFRIATHSTNGKCASEYWHWSKVQNRWIKR